jgi:hypothetical protein
MVPVILQGSPRRTGRAHLPAELERALRNCSAALQSLGAAEARVGRQLEAVQADLASLTRKPFTPLKPLR